MAQLVMLVLDDPDKTDEIIDAWIAAGVSGVTILPSSGLRHRLARRGGRDDLPLMPTLSSLLRGREEPQRTLFAIVQDNFNVEALVAATEKITGELDDPHTGILFVVPVTQVWGLNRREGGG